MDPSSQPASQPTSQPTSPDRLVEDKPIDKSDLLWQLSLLAAPVCCMLQGGPDRLSRHDIAMAVAKHCSLDSKAVLAAQSADVKR